MLRKTIKNIALLDLQNFTAEALREIKKIESCAMLLIPKNASDEWKNAYAKITIRNVASIIEVSYGKYSVLNGMVVLNDKNVSDDCLYIVNGIIILETVEKIPDLCVNGLLLKRKKSRYEMTRMNGRSVEVDDNVVIKPYPNTIEIDGVTYPQVKLDTSSESHPFYTGAQTRIVEAGRVEKFRQKFAAKSAALNASAEAAKAAKAKK